MSTFPKSVVGSQYFTLSEVKAYVRDAEPPQHSRVGCPKLGWIDIHVAMLKPISIYSLENWIKFSLRWWWHVITPFLAYLGQL